MRHPELSLPIPQPTSLRRGCGFNLYQLTHFLKLLGHFIAQSNNQPARIFIMNESILMEFQKLSKNGLKKTKTQKFKLKVIQEKLQQHRTLKLPGV